MKHIILIALFLTVLVGLSIYGPIPQNQRYHDFADKRIVMGIPHFLDVASNLAFLIPGLWGLSITFKAKNSISKLIFITIFSGFVFLAFGSVIYHLDPDNFRLMFDRIPIAVIIMAFLGFIIFDLIGKEVSKKTFVPLVFIGVLSVIYWYWTEVSGNGDLRPYLIIQFFPIIAIPLLIYFNLNRVNYLKEIYFIFGFFILAKITESLDEEIYDILKVISGHNLKHFFMAVSGIFIVLIAKKKLNNLIRPNFFQSIVQP